LTPYKLLWTSDDDAPSDGEIEEGLSSAASTSAFVASSIKSSTALRMSDKNVPVLEAPVKPVLPAMSKSMPFDRRDGVLTHHSGLFTFLYGSLAGDVGFDPLGFAKSSSDVMKYQNGHLAMIALQWLELWCLTHMKRLVG
jgi:hypothetical protein